QERIVAKNMILKAGQIPVLYIPYFSQSLKDKSFPIELIPGKNSEWGYHVLGRWRYNLNEEHKGKIHFDWYEKRGRAGGLTHKMESSQFGEGLFNYYYIDDELYSLEEREELFDEYPERSAIDAKYLEDDRYKAQFSYHWQPTPHLSVTSEFNKFSDENFMKDFFEREYEIEPHPLSYTLIDYSFERSSLSLLTQKRANRFFTETEYLPQLEYDFYSQPLFDSPLYFESQSKIGNLTRQFERSSLDYDAVRVYSHNVLSYPKRIAWLHLTPYVGSFSTFYSKNFFGDENISREALEAGISMSTKIYKMCEGGFSIFGEEIDKMRHVITPQLDYAYIHDPTVSGDNLFRFDESDELVREERITFALTNKLEAKNENRVWDFVYFSPSVEYRINREGEGSFFDNIKAELEFYPRESFSLTSDTEYDVVDRAFKEANVDFTWRDTEADKYSISFGHRYARDDSSQSTFQGSYQLTSKLQLRNYLRYEYKTGEFQEQEYSLRTDLHCWWMDVGVNIDEGKDFTFWVIFRLKSFPDVHVGFDRTFSGAKEDY
ncbi:MAG: LPS assembly protein LptD, partial [Candidatus Omnitrophota bacterium]